MADAGDLAAAQYNSDAAYNNPRRFSLPPVQNDYAAITLNRPVTWVKAAGNSPFVEINANTTNNSSLHFVVPWTNFYTAGSISKPPGALTYRSILSGSALATQFQATYDMHRIRCMKLIFEPVTVMPQDNFPALDIYIWWVANHSMLAANLDNEFADINELRSSLRAERITKVSNRYGHTFSLNFVPQMIENVAGVPNATHVIPRPWLQGGDAALDANIYTPVIIFRRPYNADPAGSLKYSVTLKTCIEYKEPNPPDIQ